MIPQLRGRTAGTLIAAMLIIAINTLYSVVFDRYSAGLAWAVVAITVVLLVLVLRFQQRLTALSTLLILALPILIATAGLMLGV
jgi:hypothetical protein